MYVHKMAETMYVLDRSEMYPTTTMHGFNQGYVANFCASSFYSVLFSFLLYWLLLSSVLSAILIQF